MNNNMYVVTGGDYLGELWICVDDTDDTVSFLSYPKNINHVISRDLVDSGISEGILEYIEPVPDDMVLLINEQFKYNAISDNRRKQSDSSNMVDSKEPTKDTVVI